MNPDKSLAHGLFGTATSAAGITISLTEAEQWLRITSLCVGITVGILTALSVGVSLWRKWKNKKIIE